MDDALSRWHRNSEYSRLLSSSLGPMPAPKTVNSWIEKEVLEFSPAGYFFSIRTLADDKLIGDLALDGVDWSGRDAFVGIGIGETEYWGMGYGTDAINILLRFALTEVNLQRVTLSVFEYNTRAIRSYEKAGSAMKAGSAN